MTRKLSPRAYEIMAALALQPSDAPFGLNPRSFGGEAAAAVARRLEPKGYVKVDRVSERHLRYSLTTKGRVQVLLHNSMSALVQQITDEILADPKQADVPFVRTGKPSVSFHRTKA